ncbi:hypothetical protein [uncultured Clostridium sp.]|uniref:hypothetical protein n=1 Tax=uncultured Clostridium sp. TaxID=59620 RepID=UPI0025F624ED|nr:hypothetical protein [uncultured Clostridium sp.]
MKEYQNEPKFVGYEYTDVTVKRTLESVYTDSFENFGWNLEGSSVPAAGSGTVILKFKRDRKIPNKTELTRLQRQFEACVSEIGQLETSKVLGASAAAFGIGIIGTAFMAGSVFAITHQPVLMTLSIVLAVPGFLGWIAPYFCYRGISHKKSRAVAPLIDQKYEEIYQVCERANALLK